MREIFIKLSKLKRSIIFLILLLGMLIPFFVRFKFPYGLSPSTRAVYEYIDRLPEGSVILVSVDYGPSTLPETEPMLEAILKHAFLNNVRVIGMTLMEEGTNLGLRAFDHVEKEFREKYNIELKYGFNYVYLGFKSGAEAAILGMGEDISKVFPKDYYGTPVGDLPLMFDVKNYNNIALVITISSTLLPQQWIVFAHGRYGVPLAIGSTAVLATDWYPYLQSGQIIGLIGGLRGAAEYENVLSWKFKMQGLQLPSMKAVRNMNSVTIAELLIILFIILGNIGYFLERKGG